MSIQGDVQAAFQAAVTLFNNHNISIMQYIDADASVYSISGQLGYHPKHAVRAYFQEEFLDNPNFNPASLTPTVTLNLAKTGATISDTALWTDTHYSAGSPLKILYVFTFVLRPGNPSPTNAWLLSTMWGS